MVAAVLCGLLGSVALAALAGARRTESAYGRYLTSINASDVFVNVPSPDLSLLKRVSRLPGIHSSAAWLGLDANPVVHGRVDPSFLTNGFAGSTDGEFFTQDTMTVLAGHLPSLRSPDEIALSAGVARLFGVGVGGRVTYQFDDALDSNTVVTGERTYRVAAIVALPPVLVDQFDQVQSAVLPPAATAAALRLPHAVAFSWDAVRLDRGKTGITGFQRSVDRLAARVGQGYVFSLRQLDQVHQQVQEAIRPQAVALALLGAFALLALFVLVTQALAQGLERSTSQAPALRALGCTRTGAALACGLGGALSMLAGVLVAVVGAWALSPLAPVGPVRQVDPARGLQFDVPVLAGGGLVLFAALSVVLFFMAWRAVRLPHEILGRRSIPGWRLRTATGLPLPVLIGSNYALGATPGSRPTAVRANLIGSVVAVAAVVTAVVFGASLNGLVTNPDRYGWNWNVLLQVQGGYGNFLPDSATPSTLGDGDGALDAIMAATPGVAGWSTFGFTQLSVGGRTIPVLGLATHDGTVEPPTVTGAALTDSGPVHIGHGLGPDEIELGALTLQQLHKVVGDTVRVGSGPASRHLRVVGTVTLPSIGVSLSDHVSLGRGAMLPESTLMAIEGFGTVNKSLGAEAFSAIPSTVAINVRPGVDPHAVVQRVLAGALAAGADPGDVYQVTQVRGAAIVNAGQMGSQPVALAVAVAASVLISLSATVLAATRKRRRDLALLKTLGMNRGQLGAIVTCQAVWLLVIAVVIGLPLGLLGGRWVWSSFAGSLGVVPVVVVPLGALVAGLAALVVAGAALAGAPAWVAAHTPTTLVLRAE